MTPLRKAAQEAEPFHGVIARRPKADGLKKRQWQQARTAEAIPSFKKTGNLARRVGRGCVSLFFVFASLSASSFAGGDYGLPGEFLNAGAGAKPQGMGRAWTAVADDINALYWNPAGISMYRSGQVLFQYSPLELGGSYQYMAYSQPLFSLGSYGVAVANTSSGKISRIGDINPEAELGTFTDRESAALLAYSYRFGDLFSMGTNLKLAEHVIDGRSARGKGMDLGAIYQLREDKYKVGVMVRNLVQPVYAYESQKEIFPRILRVGGAAYFFEDRLLTAMDLEKTVGVDQNPKIHLGIQTYFFQNLFVRLGADQTEYTAGFGFRWNTLEVDYAAGYQELGLSSNISVKIFFGGYEVDVRAVPRVFSPAGLKKKTIFRVRAANRKRIVNWILSIRNARNEVVRSFQGFSAPPPMIEWDGRDAHGQPVEAGEYVYRMATTDSKGRKETTMLRTLKILAPTPFEIEAR